jgi:hypothetical protein
MKENGKKEESTALAFIIMAKVMFTKVGVAREYLIV